MFRAKVRTAMRENGWTLEDIAMKIETTPRNFERIMVLGDNPNKGVLLRLQKLLDLKDHEIITVRGNAGDKAIISHYGKSTLELLNSFNKLFPEEKGVIERYMNKQLNSRMLPSEDKKTNYV